MKFASFLECFRLSVSRPGLEGRKIRGRLKRTQIPADGVHTSLGRTPSSEFQLGLIVRELLSNLAVQERFSSWLSISFYLSLLSLPSSHPLPLSLFPLSPRKTITSASTRTQSNADAWRLSSDAPTRMGFTCGRWLRKENTQLYRCPLLHALRHRWRSHLNSRAAPAACRTLACIAMICPALNSDLGRPQPRSVPPLALY